MVKKVETIKKKTPVGKKVQSKKVVEKTTTANVKVEKVKAVHTLEGKVVANTREKTLTVVLEQLKKHRIYKKYFKVHKKLSVHFEGEKVPALGSIISITRTRPYSKNKKWKFVQQLRVK